jgi:ubiquinone/menaquinone biosynthesis C-methylase UbiE
MQTPFDKIATVYDELFTGTRIGKIQRNIISKYLDEALPSNQQLNILELNCGTGEDAVYFAKKGLCVIATDVSEEMLKVTKEKINKSGMSNYVTTKKLDLTNTSDFNFNQKFDLIFSNFGGLNCVDKESLKKLSAVLSSILNERGRIIFVLMPKFSFWDSFYCLIKLKLSEIFRRASSKPLKVNLSGENVKTFYYSPKEIAYIFGAKFKVQNIKPIGFFIPPSFFNKFFLKKKKTLRILETFENSVSNFSFLSKFSDHYLIDMELKG